MRCLSTDHVLVSKALAILTPCHIVGIPVSSPSATQGQEINGLPGRREEDVERAVRLFMAEEALSRDDALRRIVRDWLAGHGYLDATEPGLDEPHANQNGEEPLGGAYAAFA